MGGVATAEDLGRLFTSFLQPGALVELAVLAACLGLAWLAVRLMRGPEPQRGSIWFGRGVVDGVLFPVFALLLALVGRWALQALDTVPHRGVQARGAGAAVAAGDPAHGAGAARGLPDLARHARGRAQRLVAGLDRDGAVDHRRAAADPGGTGRHPVEDRQHAHLGAQPARGRDRRHRGDGGGAVDLRGAGTEAAEGRHRQPQHPQDGGQRAACAAAVRGPDVRAVGGRHRPHRAGRAGRRARCRHRLRPAEAGGQLHQRLRHPGRAQHAHRRHGEGRQLRGPHHRHQHALHRDPRAQRPREHRAERDADHVARRERLAGRLAGAAHHRGAGGLRHRRADADPAAHGRRRGRAARAGGSWPRRAAVGIRRRRAGADGAVLDRRPRERPGQHALRPSTWRCCRR